MRRLPVKSPLKVLQCPENVYCSTLLPRAPLEGECTFLRFWVLMKFKHMVSVHVLVRRYLHNDANEYIISRLIYCCSSCLSAGGAMFGVDWTRKWASNSWLSTRLTAFLSGATTSDPSEDSAFDSLVMWTFRRFRSP